MKFKVICISVLSLALAFMTSCEPVEEIQPVDNGTVGLRLEAVSPFEGTSIAWNAVSDRVGVYVRESEGSEFLNENAYYAAFSSTPRSLFKPLKDDFKLSLESGKKYDVTAYYPYSSKVTDPTAISVSVSEEQLFDPLHPEEFFKDSSMLVSKLDAVTMEELVDLKMRSVVSFVKITLSSVLPMNCSAVELVGEDGLSFEGGAYNLLTGTLSEGEKGSKVTVRFPSDVTIGSTPISVIAKINPLYQGKSITVNPIVDSDEESVTVDVPQGGFVPGSGVEYTVSYSFDAVDLSASGTANAYIVTEPGTLYSFDATVKGNGNSSPVEWSCNGDAVKIDFDTDIVPARAELLWYSSPKTKDGYHGQSPVEKTSVAYIPSLGKILFKTPAKFVDGNAVIAAFDESGNIVWSWNIWAVEGYDPISSASKVGRFTMMDRNLGAVSGREAGEVSDNIEAASAIGNYYQWGRKDPFPAAPEYTDKDCGMDEGWGNPAYTELGGYALGGGKIFSDDRVANGRMLASVLGENYSLERAVAESVKYPHKWMFGGKSDACYPQYTWTSGDGDYDRQSPARKVQWEGLWGSVDNVSNVKTIYDPCPPGWKVPTGDVYYTAFEDVKLSDGGHGVYSEKYRLYFPFAGQRKAGFGGSVIVKAGEIMMSTATAVSSMNPLRATVLISNGNISSGRVTSSNSYAGAGYQVRCVREEVDASSQSYGKQSGHDAALMGDSITRTWRDRGRSSFFTENNYLNKGADGTTTINMINRFTNDILKDDPAVVMIMGGTNDLAWNENYFECEEDIVSNVKLMAYAARDLGAKVVIGSLCPSRSMWWKDDAWRKLYDGDYIAGQIKVVNAQLKAMAQAEGFAYVDFYSALVDEQGGLAARYCWDFGNGNLDSVHPNADAFLVMEGILKPVIDGLLADPSAITPGHGGLDDMDKWIW